MPYKVAIVAEDGSSTEVMVHPAEIEIHSEGNSLHVCVAWCKRTLVDDPAGLLAVTTAWPDRERLALLDRNGNEVFQGPVRKFSYDCDKFYLESHSHEVPNPDEMVLAVERDAADPMGIVATVDNMGRGEVSIDFGDGSAPVDDDGVGGPVPHTYQIEGEYTVTAADKDEPGRYRSQTVSVPYGS